MICPVIMSVNLYVLMIPKRRADAYNPNLDAKSLNGLQKESFKVNFIKDVFIFSETKDRPKNPRNINRDINW